MQVARDHMHSKLRVAEIAKLWVLQHDKTPDHTSFLVSDYLSKHHTAVFTISILLCSSSVSPFPRNDSQVPKKCSDEGIRGGGNRRLAIRIYIFV
ncbi:hypothetical protein AVEN_31586-1 [Araneus ventricosus]|uniref:Uncharacterized protein n=1 Tax=Araneus ventricosus TaxID=182803 RepID=A0A4Y2SXR5_ARAVE|nr:hypothetical protein AVEN_267781-1 [Araneus ventricosus]GBN92755.1 hypothetical protein AVEN_250122-1 [Araneus ventricosus]GBO10101.1 hypothetical protein AVEN_178166-1 [Araneus ventricosus]GBO10205.1 hypothetical protein AVEN_31586-1 [Araneus ventricosus]